jgi:periplasmic protein TonB
MIRKLRYCFLLVLLLHLLLLLSFTVILTEAEPPPSATPEEDAEQKAEKVLPAYVFQQQTKQDASPALPTLAASDATRTTSPDGMLKSQTAAKPTIAKRKVEEQIGRQIKTESGGPKNDGTTIIADKPTDKPLIKLLSRATASKLRYPKSAQDFQITGVVRIGFTITPAGIVSQVSLIKSSGSAMLDNAGLTAISSISPVSGVEDYLKETRFLTVSIIFGA